MNDLELTARALVEAAGNDEVADLRPACAGVIEAALKAPWDELHGALTLLTRGITVADPLRAASVAVTCGALVERGGHPEIPVTPILARLSEALVGARRLLEIASKEAPGDEIDQELFDSVRRRHPAESRDWAAIDGFGLAAIACLSRRAGLRDAALGDAVLVDRLAPFADIHPRLSFLALLLRVLEEEELVVLQPSTRQGWRVELSGVADNFQLQTLLAAAIVGEGPGKVPGTPPPPEIVAVMDGEGPQRLDAQITGWWNLYQWNSLLPDRTLPQGDVARGKWVAYDGAPDDLEEFEGTRVLLVSPATAKRTWHASRTFPGLNASVDVVETLAPEAVDALLARMAAKVPRDA